MARKAKYVLEENQRFGRLTVIDPDRRMESKSRGGFQCAALCQCDCGTVKLIRLYCLVKGETRSCGCLQREFVQTQDLTRFREYSKSEANRERLRALHTKHGLSGHPLYWTWANMMGRCYSETSQNYASYGGRGIEVHEPWHDVAVFIAWVEENLGDRPAGCTFDRENNDGNYEPGNVRWADSPTQRRNTRKVNVLQEQIASLQRELDRLRGGDAE